MSELASIESHFLHAQRAVGVIDPHAVGRDLLARSKGYSQYHSFLEALLQEKGDYPVAKVFTAYKPLFEEFSTMFAPGKEKLGRQVMFNQRLAQGLIAANTWDNQAKQGAITFVSIVEEMHTHGIELGTALYQLLLGARAHAGIVDIFVKHGYKAYFPNLADPQEVLKWDGHAHVDVAVMNPSNGDIYLVDAKGVSNIVGDKGAVRHLSGDAFGFTNHHNTTPDTFDVAQRVIGLWNLSGKIPFVSHLEIALAEEHMDAFGSVSTDMGSSFINTLERRRAKIHRQ